MEYREKLNWIGLAACMLGAAYSGSLLVQGRAALDAPETVFALVGFTGLGWAGLALTLRRTETDDERDVLIRSKSLGFAAQVMIFGLMAALVLSNGGPLGAVPKPAIWLVLLLSTAAASGRSLYLYRHCV